jgi:FPC/CPF motif-containing protein YcgG
MQVPETNTVFATAQATFSRRERKVPTVADSRLQILRPDRGWNPGPAWLGDRLEDFRKNLLNPEFPCNFGRVALDHRELYLTWVDDTDPSTLPADLADFLERSQREPEKRSPLAVFVQPADPPRTDVELDEQFWSLLQYLHDHDDQPWPEDLPRNPDEEGWQFSFHGASMFVFALVPTNRLRRSRNLCDCLVLIFQPRSVFAGIEVGTPGGNLARQGIRRRLAGWDPVGPHPSFGHHGVLSTDEWRQYFITDENSDVHATCPFSPNQDRVDARRRP